MEKAKTTDLEKVSEQIVTYKDINGRDVSLTVGIMKRILPSLKAAKDDEIINFCMRCSAMKLNPFLDVHNVTFGDNEILVPIVKKDYYIQNAHKNQDYKGFSAGIVVMQDSGAIIERQGTILSSSEELLGGWAKVQTEKRGEYYVSVGVEEYQMKKSDGTINKMWRSKPATMIRKVALSQALREAFPEYSNTYSEDEIPEKIDDSSVEDANYEEITNQRILVSANENVTTKERKEKPKKSNGELTEDELFGE